jgi:hypothetical protein
MTGGGGRTHKLCWCSASWGAPKIGDKEGLASLGLLVLKTDLEVGVTIDLVRVC